MTRQNLNDKGMATLFKVNSISAALENQDEIDRQKIYLMGVSNSNKSVIQKSPEIENFNDKKR